MWAMAQQSVGLFLRGKLFADPHKVYRQLAIGIAATAILLIVSVVAGAPILVGAILAGFLGGALQPYLFRDLRYR